MGSRHAPFSIVLLGRFEGKDRDVADVLAREFGKDQSWALQIVMATPIVLLDNLTAEQAEAIRDALADVEAAGSRIEVRDGTEDLPKLSWPFLPRVRGRLISEYAASFSPSVTTSITVPCPYTGQPMRVTLSINIGRVLGASDRVSTSTALPAIQVQATAAKPSGPPSVPTPSRALTPVRPAAPVNAEEGIDELEEIIPQTPSEPVAPPAASSGLARQFESDSVPTPSAPMPPPMNLEAFEARQHKTESPAGVGEAQGHPAEDLASSEEAHETRGLSSVGGCSVFIGKTANSKVHQLLAEIKGIPLEEAVRDCQRPLVAVVKQVGAARAEEIKQRFAALNVMVRIARTKRQGD